MYTTNFSPPSPLLEHFESWDIPRFDYRSGARQGWRVGSKEALSLAPCYSILCRVGGNMESEACRYTTFAMVQSVIKAFLADDDSYVHAVQHVVNAIMKK